MKVQHVTVSENSVHNSCVVLTVVWTWNFVLPLSANVTESAAWLEVSRPWFLFQVNCERGKCVNRRLPCCRGMVWLHACRRATVTCVVLDRVGSQVCFFSTLCWYPCCVSVSTAQCRAHTHLYITSQRTCVTCPTTAIFFHPSGPACAIQKLRVTFHVSLSHLR